MKKEEKEKKPKVVISKNRKSKMIKKAIQEVVRIDPKKMNPKKFDKLHGKPYSHYRTLLDIPAVDIDGKPIERLGNILKGKKLIMVVNVASRCGLTKKTYTYLNELYN
jgi:hypothetical protein